MVFFPNENEPPKRAVLEGYRHCKRLCVKTPRRQRGTTQGFNRDLKHRLKTLAKDKAEVFDDFIQEILLDFHRIYSHRSTTGRGCEKTHGIN
jgi:hypothetical protein